MAEAVLRQHRKKMDRWMPREKRRWTWTRLRGAAVFSAKASPTLLLAFADMLGMPSGLQAAYASALAAVGGDVRPALAGWAAALVLRPLSGLPLRWESLLTLVLTALAPFLLCGRGTAWLMAFAAVVMLPTGIGAMLTPTAAEMLQGWGAVAVAVLSAPVLARALRALKAGKHLSALEERVAVGYLAAMCICGGARMLFLGVNVGMLLAGTGVLASAMVLGVSTGAMLGMLSGMALAMQGLPLTAAVALALGGFLAGVTESLSRRRLTCGAFVLGSYLPLLLCRGTGLGCGLSLWCAGVLIALLPRPAMERVKGALRRFLPNDPAPGDAYASAALGAWEQTIAALARAVPGVEGSEETHTGAWWEEHLCQGCAEYERCGCMTTDAAAERAEQVWGFRHTQEDIWRDALERLRGLGCQRLYYLMEGMNALRREDEAAQRAARQAEAQREMLVTHLTALSGAARRFAMLSAGESWWDGMTARRIRRVLEERAIPATLSYVRRVQGHVQAAFELQFITGARRQAEEMCTLVSAVLGVPMQTARLDGDRVLVTERPLLTAAVGVAAEALSEGAPCGDTAWTGVLEDGRFLAALSDGMGHGEKAALASRQTVELLRLCLDAGYSHQQTLTAVNGMMLLKGGERFATADVLTIDLWKGRAALDKLGAAASWVCQQGVLTRVTGGTLPLGIVEEIAPDDHPLRLCAGDAVVLLTDGVEDAFPTAAALESAITRALTHDDPSDAARALLADAFSADAARRRDDQSAVFLYLRESASACEKG